jgi:hypothetical protein
MTTEPSDPAPKKFLEIPRNYMAVQLGLDIVAMLTAGVCTYAFLKSHTKLGIGEDIAFSIVAAIVLLVLLLNLDRALGTFHRTERSVLAARVRLQEAEQKLALENKGSSDDRLALSALWEVTHSRIDLYHQIATGQARQSFAAAQLAAGVGFILVVFFAVLATLAHNSAGAITAGALGAVSAALAGYIGRTFVRSQESAASNLRAYFDQPLEFSKYLAAERLLASAAELNPDSRASIVTEIVRAIVISNSLPYGIGKNIQHIRVTV